MSGSLSVIWAQPHDLGSGCRQLTPVAVASISASVEHKHGGQVQIISALQPIISVQEAKVKVGNSICALSICCFILNHYTSSHFRSPAAFHRSMSASDRDRDREVERITSKYTSSPVGPQTVFLSKKMKELTEKQQQSSSPVPFSNCESIKPSYEVSTPTKMPASSHNNDEYGKTERTTRSLLDELSNKKIGGNDLSPTDSFIDRMIMSAQLDINSPMDFGISRQSSVISLTKHKDSPFQEYRSLPSSRLLETDAMKSETKYLESRRSPVPMKEYAHDKLLSSAAFENSPLRTYSQSQVGLSPRDRANSFHDIREREEAGARGQTRPRARHQTLPYGVGSTELTAAKFDMDMKNIIRELEDTGFFHQVRILEYYEREALGRLFSQYLILILLHLLLHVIFKRLHLRDT